MHHNRRRLCRLDRDRRITIPAELRRDLVRERKKLIIVSPGRNGSVLLFLPGQFDTEMDSLLKGIRGPEASLRRRALARAVLSSSLEVFPDRRGRVTLEKYMLLWARRGRVWLRWTSGPRGSS